jgi:hypothetical protein
VLTKDWLSGKGGLYSHEEIKSNRKRNRHSINFLFLNFTHSTGTGQRRTTGD